MITYGPKSTSAEEQRMRADAVVLVCVGSQCCPVMLSPMPDAPTEVRLSTLAWVLDQAICPDCARPRVPFVERGRPYALVAIPRHRPEPEEHHGSDDQDGP